jgi:hypothetical protein
MQAHPELHDFELPNATSLDISAEELVRHAGSISDHELGVIKEQLESAGYWV